MHRTRLFVGVAAALVIAVLAWVASSAISRVYLAEGRAQAGAVLALTVRALDGHLQRFAAVPGLLADQETVRALVANPGDPAARMAMSRWLKSKNDALDSSDIYVMTPDGVTIAASNFDRPDSFVGQNFSYRPYFSGALAGSEGRFYGIGTTSGVRGYYFAAPVRDPGGAVAGVVAVKIGLDTVEAEWRRQEARTLVTDPEGIVFLSSEPAWLYQALDPLTPEARARTGAIRRYAETPLQDLPHTRSQDQGHLLTTVPGGDGVKREYLEVSEIMPQVGWRVHVLLDTAYLRAQARLAIAAALMFLCGTGAGLLMLRQRRARLAERIALQERAKAELERRVVARTADLAQANALIETEVAERRLTEHELRRTQADLVQAGKLAALGTMSAALSHEINQPLAAARNYADSAAILIDRGEGGRAKENVVQILSLIDRMAAIARHLRNVARKPDAPLQDIALAGAVDEALVLAAPRMAGAVVSVDLPDGLPMVRGGPVRLQQVLVNLLSNAADAMEAGPDRRIEVRAGVDGDHVRLTVRDHGPGVAPAIADRIFDPFFTTKRVGSGLGLGLSISYNIMKDFGGDLRVANDPGGGAVFTMVLRAATVQRVAAE